MEGIGQRFVYILRSERDPSRHYVGRTANVDERLRWHNEGLSGQTVLHRPWRILVTVEFADGPTAARFERYLKSGSGRAFAKRHFAPGLSRDGNARGSAWGRLLKPLRTCRQRRNWPQQLRLKEPARKGRQDDRRETDHGAIDHQARLSPRP